MCSLKELVVNTNRTLAFARWYLRKIEDAGEDKSEIHSILFFLREALRLRGDINPTLLYSENFLSNSMVKLQDIWLSNDAEVAFHFENCIMGGRLKGKEHIGNFSRYVDLVVDGLSEAAELVLNDEFYRAGDCVDAIHALPSAAVDPNWGAENYWNTYLSTYQNKWGSIVFKKYKPLFHGQ